MYHQPAAANGHLTLSVESDGTPREIHDVYTVHTLTYQKTPVQLNQQLTVKKSSLYPWKLLTHACLKASVTQSVNQSVKILAT